MQLKESSFVNIRGRLDEDVWEDKNSNTRRSIVIVAEDIEYAGGSPKEGSANSKAEKADPQPPVEPDPTPESPANYKLLAFQWADAHLCDLQERCSEAVSQGLTELLLTENELPVTESWPDICDELAHAGYKTSVLAEGIKINLIGVDKNAGSPE